MTEDTQTKKPARQRIDPSAIDFKNEEIIPQEKEEPAPTPRRRFEDLPPAAQRALMEAEERRKERDVIKESQKLEKEYSGRGGLDPSRYDDYEIGGRAIDF